MAGDVVVRLRRRLFYAKMILNSLLRRRSRLLTALLAVTVGAATLSGLATVCYGIPQQLRQEFRAYGANLLILGEGAPLTADALAAVAAQLPVESLVGLAPYRYQTVKVNEQPFLAAGTTLDEARKASPYWLVRGNWPQAGREALVGREVAETIGLVPGSPFAVTGLDAAGRSFSRDVTVVGILETGGKEEGVIYLSLADFTAMVGDGPFDLAEASLALSGAELEGLAARLGESVPGAVARPLRQVVDSEASVLDKLQTLLYLVTAIILMLTMISVATTMLAAVTERRREIGLKKALGASDRAMIGEFLGESLLVGGLGGILGGLFGYFFAQTISAQVFARPLELPWLLLPLTALGATLVAALASTWPAKKAAQVEPAIVLRGE